jgi:hypothetical protein
MAIAAQIGKRGRSWLLASPASAGTTVGLSALRLIRHPGPRSGIQLKQIPARQRRFDGAAGGRPGMDAAASDTCWIPDRGPE